MQEAGGSDDPTVSRMITALLKFQVLPTSRLPLFGPYFAPPNS